MHQFDSAFRVDIGESPGTKRSPLLLLFLPCPGFFKLSFTRVTGITPHSQFLQYSGRCQTFLCFSKASTLQPHAYTESLLITEYRDSGGWTIGSTITGPLHSNKVHMP